MAGKVLLVNKSPRKKRRKSTAASRKKTRTVSRRRAAPKRKARTYRRNPIGGGMVNRVIERQLKPAAIQAGGALAVDVAFGYLGSYLPAQLTTGMVRHFTKGVGAVLLSTLAANFVRSSTANDMAKGALTVILHDTLKESLQTFAPQLPLGYFSPAPVLRNSNRSLGLYTRAGNRSGMPSANLLPAPSITGNPTLSRVRKGDLGLYTRLPNASGAGSGFMNSDQGFDTSNI